MNKVIYVLTGAKKNIGEFSKQSQHLLILGIFR
jgi:hypothetical protein